MKKIKNKIGFKLFYNDKFVMFFSVLVAFIAWICVASTTQESSIFTVTDIPINLPELTDGLRYFNGNDIKAEVKISGNALVVTGVTKDRFKNAQRNILAASNIQYCSFSSFFSSYGACSPMHI